MKRKPQKYRKKDKTKFHRFSDVNQLKSRIQAEAPSSGVYYYKFNEEDVEEITNTASNILNQKKIPIQFDDLPLSRYTKQGLKDNKFDIMTDIQRCTIPHALIQRDVLACAKTGSGKTLAFLVPLLEMLYRNKWSSFDGLGALIIVPVRELAIQTFDVLRKIGKHHTFSAGVIIGGNSELDEEKARIRQLNILIATPGRLLHHLNETPGFTCDNLKILVLDEVDRILDMGFSEEMDQILENIPKSAQILLSSATLSLKIQRLIKINLKQPEYISLSNYDVEENKGKKQKTTVTPSGLTQYYMLVEAHDKMNTVFSFLRTHTKNKSLLFASSCKQVRFIYEALRSLRPGVSLYELHGRQKQTKRLEIYSQFADVNKKTAALFATDVASRGLDMPSVDWVVQIDCPEDVDTYIHRVGRTARYKSKGNALLLLLPSEVAFLNKLEQKGITMKKINPNKEKIVSIEGNLKSILSGRLELMKLAQKAFISYAKTMYIMKDKEVFNINKIDLQGLAKSMGLSTAPVIKVNSGAIDKPQGEKKGKLSKLKEKIALKKEQQKIEESDDELLRVTRRIEVDESESEDKEDVKKLPELQAEGVVIENEDVGESGEGEEEDYINKVKERLQNEETQVKETWKQRITKKRKEQREKNRKKELEKKGFLEEMAILDIDQSEEDNDNIEERPRKVKKLEPEPKKDKQEELEDKVLGMLDDI